MAESVFDELKKIEKKIDETSYTVDQISYYIGCDLVTMTLSDLKPLKDALLRNKIIGAKDNLTLTRIDDAVTDIRAICQEWHFDDDIASRLTNIVE